MTTLYVVYSGGECGELQGVFTEREDLLHFWSCNDATWREEYFNGLMEKIGFTTKEPTGPLYNRLEKKLIKHCKKLGY